MMDVFRVPSTRRAGFLILATSQKSTVLTHRILAAPPSCLTGFSAHENCFINVEREAPEETTGLWNTFLDAAKTVPGTPYVFLESGGFGDFA